MASHDDHGKHGKHKHGEHVILPKMTYYRVFGALLVLTVLTVLVAGIDLGAFNVTVALGIAIVKAALVVMYFMMLKFDSRVNTMVFAGGVFFLLILLAFTMLDTELRGRFDRAERLTVMEQRRAAERSQDPGIVDPTVDAEQEDEFDAAPVDTPAVEPPEGAEDLEPEQIDG